MPGKTLIKPEQDRPESLQPVYNVSARRPGQREITHTATNCAQTKPCAQTIGLIGQLPGHLADRLSYKVQGISPGSMKIGQYQANNLNLQVLSVFKRCLILYY